MNEYVLAILLFGSAFGLLISGIPIWSGLAGISVAFIILSPHLLPTIPYVLHGSMDSFALLAIPLFILLSAPIAATHASKDLYVVKNIAPDVPMSQVLLGVIPFVLIDLLVIVLLCVWPELALWLPNKMIGQPHGRNTELARTCRQVAAHIDYGVNNANRIHKRVP
jgi:TRAP-type mannitol/chloroaromatic compound transport system permease large subunit